MNAVAQPTRRMISSDEVNAKPKSSISIKERPNITGTARKKVNSAAVVLERPKSKAPIIVTPDLDVPGIDAKIWKQPIKNAVLYVAEEMLVDSTANVKEEPKVVVTFAEVGQQIKLEQVKQPEATGETKKYLTCYRDIQKILISEKAKIIHCKHVKDGEKSDLLVLLDRFKDALFRGNKQEIKAAFISYKYAISGFKRIDSEVDDVERILKFCNAI